MKMFKVGGMRFLRIGRLQVSWCICTGKPKRAKKYSGRTLARQMRTAYKLGWDHGIGMRPLQIADLHSAINN